MPYPDRLNSFTYTNRVIEAAIDDARFMCERTLGEAPDVQILGNADSFAFSYIPSYMRHVCFEVRSYSFEWFLLVAFFSIGGSTCIFCSS